MTFSVYLEHNRTALLRLVVALFEASRLGSGRSAVLSPIIWRAVLFTLRPLEAAARRLIIVKALLLRQGGFAPKARVSGAKPIQPIPRGEGAAVPTFRLFDQQKLVGVDRQKFAKHAPRIFFFDGSDPVFEALPMPQARPADAPVDATRVLKRMEALKRALEDLQREARRLVRKQVSRAAAGRRPVSGMRPGRPPGFRARGRDEADVLLRECHILALRVLAVPDTS